MKYQVHDLVELLHQSSDDDDHEIYKMETLPSVSRGASDANYLKSHFPFLAEQTTTHCQAAVEIFTDAQVAFLFERFVKNVDPVVKLLHPAVLRQIARLGNNDTPSITSTRDLHALKCAVFYVTITSLSDSDCLQVLTQSRATLLSKFQIATETAMSEANILASESMHVLQALVLYLVR